MVPFCMLGNTLATQGINLLGEASKSEQWRDEEEGEEQLFVRKAAE